jgi:hypothetical protein
MAALELLFLALGWRLSPQVRQPGFLSYTQSVVNFPLLAGLELSAGFCIVSSESRRTHLVLSCNGLDTVIL